MNRSLMLMDRLGAKILLAFWMKGQVLHRERVHLKVPDIGRSYFSVLRTRKLPMSLSRLKDKTGENEIKYLTCFRIVL